MFSVLSQVRGKLREQCSFDASRCHLRRRLERIVWSFEKMLISWPSFIKEKWIFWIFSVGNGFACPRHEQVTCACACFWKSLSCQPNFSLRMRKPLIYKSRFSFPSEVAPSNLRSPGYETVSEIGGPFPSAAMLEQLNGAAKIQVQKRITWVAEEGPGFA